MKISHMRAANDQGSLHIHTVSPEPSLIALKRRNIGEGTGQIVWPVQESLVLRAYAISEYLKRRDVDEGSG